MKPSAFIIAAPALCVILLTGHLSQAAQPELFAPSTPQWDEPLAKALGENLNGPLYSFNMKMRADEKNINALIDPSRPTGQRVKVLTIMSERLDENIAESIQGIEEKGMDEIWCSNFKDIIPKTAQLTARTNSRRTYEFTPLADEGDKEDAKIVKYLTGQITIDTLTSKVLSLKIEAKRAFKPMMLAKIDVLSMRVNCAITPDGRSYIADMNSHVKGKIMMQEFDETQEHHIYGLKTISSAQTY